MEMISFALSAVLAVALFLSAYWYERRLARALDLGAWAVRLLNDPHFRYAAAFPAAVREVANKSVESEWLFPEAPEVSL